MNDLRRMLTGTLMGFVLAAGFGVGMISMAAYRWGDDGERSGSAAAAAGAQVLEVALGELFIEPAELTVAPGDVTIRVTNEGAADHNLAIEGVGTSAMLPPGGSGTIEATDLGPGTYQMLCEVAGHADGGMRGTLVVGEGHDAAAGHGMSPEEMVAHDAEVTGSFPVETEGLGGQPLEPTILQDGTKAFELTAAPVEWEVEPGTFVSAYAYNGQVPGPEIRVEMGDRVRIELTNELPEATTLHLHGLVLPHDMDGVAVISQDAVMPGESFTYELTVRNAGSHMYHSHFNAQDQVAKGLLGAFIVEDPDGPRVAVDHTMVLNDGPNGYTINGKGFPATAPIVAREGQTVRVRYMNEGFQMHPMHLHGMPQEVIAVDGNLLDSPYLADTIPVAPGQRVDVLVRATEPGVWAFHCHILTHAEGPEGMFGMVTALIVE